MFQFSCFNFQSAYAQLIPNLGGQRAGISSYTLLKNDIDPRMIAMGGAGTTLEGNGYAAHWNPACLPELNGHNISVSTRMLYAGMNQSYVAGNIRLRETDYLALSINSFYTGSMDERTEFMPQGTGQKVSANTIAMGVSYAKMLTYKFSFGTSIRYLRESYSYYSSSLVVVDIGFIYKTDWKKLRFGVFLQNFGPNSSASGSFVPVNFINKTISPESYPTPTVFKFGLNFVPFEKDKQKLLTSIELNHPNDNASNVRIGLEYSYIDMFFVRAGYWINLIGYSVPTFGAGIRTTVGGQIVHINYAFQSSNTLGSTHTVGLSFTISKIVRETNENTAQ
ncbi:MAG: PorV/PorQ family protein [Cytophagales bacterium]|nr:PorV/PorQ family protein [Cytophagales bacterium]